MSTVWSRVNRRRNPSSALTARQLEIIRLVAAGLSNSEIAQRLVVSDHTWCPSFDQPVSRAALARSVARRMVRPQGPEI
jgi:FixJ family two-component response regulator